MGVFRAVPIHRRSDLLTVTTLVNPDRRSQVLLSFLMVAMPTGAHAHGGPLLVLFLYVPHVVVAVALLLVLWRWQAAPLAKGVAAGAVMATSAVLFAANYGIQYGAIPFPFGNGVYLLVVLAQIAIPVAVGLACGLFARRKRIPGREDQEPKK